jgi:hypothetical protein
MPNLGFSKALEENNILDNMIGCSTSNLIHHSQSQKLIPLKRRMSEPQEASE